MLVGHPGPCARRRQEPASAGRTRKASRAHSKRRAAGGVATGKSGVLATSLVDFPPIFKMEEMENLNGSIIRSHFAIHKGLDAAGRRVCSACVNFCIFGFSVYEMMTKGVTVWELLSYKVMNNVKE